MACECATNCKANLALKKSECLTLINSLNLSGATTTRMSEIYSLILDDVNRLQVLGRRIDEMQAQVAAEVAISAEDYISPSVAFGVTEILRILKTENPTDYATLSGIFNITIPDPVEVSNGLPE